MCDCFFFGWSVCLVLVSFEIWKDRLGGILGWVIFWVRFFGRFIGVRFWLCVVIVEFLIGGCFVD